MHPKTFRAVAYCLAFNLDSNYKLISEVLLMLTIICLLAFTGGLTWIVDKTMP
jgi:hypothetical protein